MIKCELYHLHLDETFDGNRPNCCFWVLGMKVCKYTEYEPGIKKSVIAAQKQGD